MARHRHGDTTPANPPDADDFVPLPLATDLVAGMVVGEYTVECKLGDGGMATVYGATHPLIGKKAAIKVMDPALSLDAGLVERFMLEARAVNAIGHPNIVDVFSFGQLTDGRSYFVMEWLQGENLYDRLWERKPTLDEALDIIDQICDALEAAHDKGIVHRDLKPANVFLTPVRGRRDLVKLLDFGVAKLISPDPAGELQAPQTMTGQVVGTPDYISPEQARAKPVDGKTDVYALGVMAYEMILGRRPFEADNTADVLRMHLSDAPPSPKSFWPEIPSAVDELLRAMLEKTPGRRPTPVEVRAIIRELRGTPPPSDWDTTSPSPGTLEASAAATPSPGGLLPQRAAPSTLDVPPLAPPGEAARQRTRILAAGLALAGFGAAMFGVLMYRVRTTSGQSLSQNATVPSPTKTAPSPKQSELAVANAPPEEGTLVVRVDVSDARIDLDGQMIAQAASGARLKVEPGEHTLTVMAPGRHQYSGRVRVRAGALLDVPIHLHHETTAASGRAAASPAAKPAPAPKAVPAAPVAKPADKRKDPDYLVDPFSGAK
ncbi:MAG: hypothetical protein JWN44_525 [Myxococcales bacterium]|nr:hypothetical protein [Myxococcales bacterium]